MKSLYYEEVERFVLFPVIHHSYEFSLAARKLFEQIKPGAVAIEYPSVLHDLILRGIQRLPRVSIILYGQPRQYIRIEPVDPFIELARLALEYQIPVQSIDLYLPDYPEILEPVPDTYAIQNIGHERYCKELLRHLPETRVEEDERRESAMAFHLQELQKKVKGSKKILVACGLSHLKGLREVLLSSAPQPFEQKPPAKLYHLSAASLGEIMGTFPFLSSVYELQRNGPVPAPPEINTSAEVKTKPLVLYKGAKTSSVDEFAKRAHQKTASAVADGDRNEILARYVQECRLYYEQEIGDQLSPQQMV
ncbi:MAG TPA: hypothetical protein VH815_07775, partial [Acidobacteriota bacterium]